MLRLCLERLMLTMRVWPAWFEVPNSPDRYYRLIAALEEKLPIGRERGGVPLVFSWTDAFQPSQHRCFDPYRDAIILTLRFPGRRPVIAARLLARRSWRST